MKKSWRLIVSTLNIFILLFSSIACNYTKTIAVDHGLSDVIKLMEKQKNIELETILIQARKIQASRNEDILKPGDEDKIIGKFDNSHEENARKWMRDNEKVIGSFSDRLLKALENQVSEIHQISKSAYVEKNKYLTTYWYTLTYLKLQYLRQDTRKILEMLSPISLIIHSPALEDDQDSLELRKKIEQTLLKIIGVGVVADQDHREVKAILSNLKQDGAMSERLAKILIKTNTNVQKEINDQAKKFKVNRQQSQKDVVEVKKQYKGITFLYTPGQKYFFITKLLTIIGNLTWGMVNTMIGAGVVIAAMAISPFSRYVDFPTFGIAHSGMQIYVDVTGMSPISGKMSLGLFELDNAAGYRFASEHEAGHAIQSAILGPFYLPTVLATYIISGFDLGLMEDLADLAAEASDVWL